jgi:hypothetical protein
MDEYKIIALDETGKASMNHLSKTFILSGLILNEFYQKNLEIQVNNLKKKYFNDENIIVAAK